MKDSQRNITLFVACCLPLVTFMGCAAITERAKNIAGLSTQALEDNRKSAVKIALNYDYNTCYKRTEEFLVNRGSYVYARDAKKRMIAIYVSEEDTTPVGIFFKIVDSSNTQVEVSSPSTYAKEFIAKRITRAFAPEKKEGKLDEEEDLESE